MILLYWMMYVSFREVRCPRVVSGDAAKHLFGILAVRGAGFSGCVGAPTVDGVRRAVKSNESDAARVEYARRSLRDELRRLSAR